MIENNKMAIIKNIQKDKKFTVLTLHGSPGCPNIETRVEGEQRANPEYCGKCGGINNLYEVVPNYKGDPSLYGCHCT